MKKRRRKKDFRKKVRKKNKGRFDSIRLPRSLPHQIYYCCRSSQIPILKILALLQTLRVAWVGCSILSEQRGLRYLVPKDYLDQQQGTGKDCLKAKWRWDDYDDDDDDGDRQHNYFVGCGRKTYNHLSLSSLDSPPAESTLFCSNDFLVREFEGKKEIPCRIAPAKCCNDRVRNRFGTVGTPFPVKWWNELDQNRGNLRERCDIAWDESLLVFCDGGDALNGVFPFRGKGRVAGENVVEFVEFFLINRESIRTE